MKAAVVRSFDAAPRYEDFTLPATTGSDEIIVDIVAAGLHPRVRSGAAGLHYADEKVLPMIPGVDAVARLPDGKLVYCVVHDTPFGTMAEQAAVNPRRCVALPDDCDAALIAAAMNPGMSSWIALRQRVRIQSGQSVFVLGATGNAGQMAIQIARLLGAGRVIGAGREISRLAASGADEIVPLADERDAVMAALGKAAGEADIVLDYLWSEPAAMAMQAVLQGRRDRSKPLDWIQIGAITGPTMSLPSEWLRSTNLRIMGSGQGSVSTKAIVAELPHLIEALLGGDIPVDVQRLPLADVERCWNKPITPGRRVVFEP
jgi:NADPH:quinone reductase-like Zn-dependent oxidoreductase